MKSLHETQLYAHSLTYFALKIFMIYYLSSFQVRVSSFATHAVWMQTEFIALN